MKVGGDDDGVLHIIMACMAQYCNYWRKRKSPIDGNIIAGISRWVGGRGRSGIHYGWGGNSIPPLHLPNNHLFIVSGWNICHEQ